MVCKEDWIEGLLSIITITMNKKELLNGLRYYQKWRKGGDCKMPYPKDVTRYIDSAISIVEITNTKLVNHALYRKEIIEKLKATRCAMILDGYDEYDSCVKYMDELIKEVEEL